MLDRLADNEVVGLLVRELVEGDVLLLLVLVGDDGWLLLVGDDTAGG